MKVRTLKRAAGAVSFDADCIIELADELVQSFVDAGAVEVVQAVRAKVESVESEDADLTEAFETVETEPERPKRKRK
jgi:hypothetical protein